jgi:pimeloyl-ACP methyl ester carboxylesterase
MNFLLLHGAWHDGSCWSAVEKILKEQGHRTFSPTLPGHGGQNKPDTTFKDCIQHVTDYLDELEEDNFVLVAHSFSGTLVPNIFHRTHKKVTRLVFQNAMVLEPGEAILDLLPPHYVDMMLELKKTNQDGNWLLDLNVFREVFASTASHHFATSVFENLNPAPLGLQFEKIDGPALDALDVPKSYVNLSEDIALPHGEWAWYPRMGERLGLHRLVQCCGDHEACYTNPTGLASAILQAAQP